MQAMKRLSGTDAVKVRRDIEKARKVKKHNEEELQKV